MTELVIDWDAERQYSVEFEDYCEINPSHLIPAADLDILRWYLEIFPGRGEKAARDRAERIEKLLEVFSSRLAMPVCRISANESVRIVSSRPLVHSLPWELIEQSATFPSTGAIVRALTTEPIAEAAAAIPLRVLLVVSRPAAQWDVPPLPVARALASLRPLGIDVELLLKADFLTLQQTLAEAYALNRPFTVVQFDVHGGSSKGGVFGIAMETQDGGREWIPAFEIARTLKGTDVRVVVTNACRSGRFATGDSHETSFPATLLDAGIPAIVAMAYDLRADAAPIFTAAFYGALASGESLIKAIRSARRALRASPSRKTRTGYIKLADWWTPVAYVHEDVRFIVNTPASGRLDSVARSIATDMRAIEDAAYHTLASLLRGRNVTIGGLGLGGQWLAALEVLRIIASLNPERNTIVLRHGLDRSGEKLSRAIEKSVASAAQADLVVVGIRNGRSGQAAHRAIEQLRALSSAQLVIVVECSPPQLPSFDIVKVTPVNADDILYMLFGRGVSNCDFVDDVLRGRTKTDLLRLFASPVLLKAFCQLSRSKGFEETEEEVQNSLVGLGRKTILAMTIRATVARYDWTNVLTILAGLMPLRVSESLFLLCVSKLNIQSPIGDWTETAESSGILTVWDSFINFHPLLAPALARQDAIDVRLKANVVAGFVSSTAEYFCSDLTAFEDQRAPGVISRVSADIEAIEQAILLSMSSEFLGETRWGRLACPMLDALLTTRTRRGEQQALTLFAEKCRRRMKDHDGERTRDEQAFWMRLAINDYPDHVKVERAPSNSPHYLLGTELVVRQLTRQRDFTGAEACVRRAINELGGQAPAITRRLYDLMAEIGELRGWPVMSERARQASSLIFESTNQPVPIAVHARRILAEVRCAFAAHVAAGRAMDNVPSIDDLPERLAEAEHIFRTLRSSADLCDLLVLSMQVKVHLGQAEVAIAKGEEALKLAIRRLDEWRRTMALLALGDSYLALFAIETARLYYGEATGCANRLGDSRLAAAAWAGFAETSFLLGRTEQHPFGFSAYQEMASAFSKLAKWATSEAPQEAVRRSGAVLVEGTTRWTAFQELKLPTPEMLRVTDITRRFVEADPTGETLRLIEVYIETLQALEPTQSAIIFLRILHDRLQGIGRTTPDMTFQLVNVAGTLPANRWPMMLLLLVELAETVLKHEKNDLSKAMLVLIRSHTDQSSEYGTTLRENSPQEWVFARYQLARLLLESDDLPNAFKVAEDVVNRFLGDDDPNAGNFFNIYGSLLWFSKGNKDAAIAAWERSRELKTRAGQNIESVDYNLRMAHTTEPPARGEYIGLAIDRFDTARIVVDVDHAKTPTELLTVRNSWRADQRPEVKAALADAFLNRLDKNVDELAIMLLHLGQTISSEMTDLGDPAGAEVRLDRCVEFLARIRADLTMQQCIYSNRGYARLTQNKKEAARSDTEIALEIITRQEYPPQDRLSDFAIAWGNRVNAAATPEDQLLDAVQAVAAIDKHALLSQANDVLLAVRRIIRKHPRHAFERVWREIYRSELPDSVRVQLGEIL
ncbi:CHAT domain-containing protein [Paraburkholderia nodosa]|uniref:CHAT domain-containing protein n=1 Tax=Paraburkholderia nodosa TaxID=392320 RepID=UPI0004B7AFBD|nr:CHAT domain-containing protein [Paraburkholderia nodosa]